MTDEEHTYGDREKAQHLAQSDVVVELGDYREQWNRQPDKLQESRRGIHG
jgi:hypothetical protein